MYVDSSSVEQPFTYASLQFRDRAGLMIIDTSWRGSIMVALYKGFRDARITDFLGCLKRVSLDLQPLNSVDSSSVEEPFTYASLWCRDSAGLRVFDTSSWRSSIMVALYKGFCDFCITDFLRCLKRVSLVLLPLNVCRFFLGRVAFHVCFFVM